MIDEQDLRTAARELAGLFRELNTAMHNPQKPRGERVMRPRPGPSEPVSIFLLSLDRDLVSRLHEYIRDAANHLEPSKIITWNGRELCEWVAWNAHGVSELDFAPDLMEELETQIHQLGRRLRPKASTVKAQEAAKNAPRRYTASEAAALASAVTGLNVERKQVTYWGRSRDMSTESGTDGTLTYDLGEVVEVAKSYQDNRKKSG